ncbi:TetR/AcrR family transcriptional regulator [uncultured Friedmanniella sp.]|uniref:TetR/AcrR family transcriptional regulator n=1 Tax=uncultured Friedmanniella sp. TaxID=335381 RepID=UPI0035CA6E5D
MSSASRAPGRPLNPAIDDQILNATQDLLIEEGFERLSMDAVARRCGASKATIYRRWPSKTALVVSAAAALLQPPPVPDTGDLREDLLACGLAYMQQEGRTLQVLANLTTATQHDPELREAFREAVSSPYAGLFDAVLGRAAERGLIRPDLDLDTLARVFPAMAYQQLAAQARSLTERDVQRVVDAVLLPALGTNAVPAPTSL